MTEPHDDLAGALHGLRGEIRDLVPVPDAAGLRARALHQLRVRRAATTAVAAAAVVAVAVGGAALLQPTAAPAPPVETPPTPPPVMPSPRPTPGTPEPLDDPIVEVDWRSATITLPPKEGCPDGRVTFIAVEDIIPTALGPVDGFPKIMLNATNAAYGDLTGDGRAEAVVEASCATSEEGLGSGHGGQLLVVAREPDGALVGLGWVGPPGAAYLSYWINGGRLLLDADPWTTTEPFTPVPGLALAYEWRGDHFTGWNPAPDYLPIVPPDPATTGPPVRPRAVASALGCPDVELHFSRTDASLLGIAEAPGATYRIPDLNVSPDSAQQYLFDLDHTGNRLLVIALTCIRGGTLNSGLAVFERTASGWQGISMLRPPPGRERPQSWRTEGDQFVVIWDPHLAPREAAAFGYRWTGTVFEPIDE